MDDHTINTTELVSPQSLVSGLKPELLTLLSQLAAFHLPFDEAAASLFNRHLSGWFRLKQTIFKRLGRADIVAPQSATAAFQAELRELEERGVLVKDDVTHTHSLSSDAKTIAYARLTTSDRMKTHHQIRRYYESLPPENLDEVIEVRQLDRSIEIYMAFVKTGKLNSASDFYERRLNNVLMCNLMANQTIIDLLTPLFPNGLDQPPALSTANRQSFQIIQLAIAFHDSGQSETSLSLFKHALKINVARKNVPHLLKSLGHYGLSLLQLNRLYHAEQAWRLSAEIAKAARYPNDVSYCYSQFMIIMAIRAEWEEADQYYQAFMAKPPTQRTLLWKTEVENGYAETLLMREMLDEADAALKRGWGFATEGEYIPGQIQNLIVRGKLALQRGQAEAAIELFNEATQKTLTKVPSNPIRDGLAQANAMAGRLDEARIWVEQSITCQSSAEVWLKLGERQKSLECVLKAYKTAWGDGAPYIHWRNLERAKKTLDELGEPYPDLPRHDPSKQDPFPYEAEIRAFIANLWVRHFMR